MDIRIIDRRTRYPPTRFVYHQSFRYYYAMGNTSARDLLENVSSGKEPAILVLGCGDFRGCIYSLWKHFDPASSLHHFHGVHFVLNDVCPAIMARNVLYLYYLSKMPSWKEEEAAKLWISNLWAVWYCHELLPSHERSLKDALAVLTRVSASLESWKRAAENPLRNIVSFSSSETLQQIRAVWEMWRTKSFGTLEALHTARMEEFKQKLAEVSSVGGMDAHVIPSITTFLGVLRTTDVSREEIDSLGCDYTEYLESGSSYAEDIFNLPHSTSRTFINPTLFENDEGKYTLQYASAPFRSFFHILEVSKCEVQKLGMSVSIAGQPLIVDDDSFQRHPLLSNCVQQFSIWVSSAAATLRAQSSRMKPNISFTFDCSHCIHFCEEISSKPKFFLAQTGFEPVFDVIYTSNLIDSISAPVMVYSTLPLLRHNGLMVCKTTLYTYLAETTEQFLEGQFGFSPELFPLIFGGRCIGHEGKYADTNANEPVPVSIMTILGNIKQARQNPTKELFFAKVSANPYKMTSLADVPPILDALYGAIHACTGAFLMKENGLITKLGMCAETAVHALLMFVTLLECDVEYLDYHFWEPLSTRLSEDVNMRPIMVHLQTQLLLHKLHLHIIFDKVNCPICVGMPVLGVISQFSTVVDPKPKGSPEKSAPFFGALIHKTTLPRWLPMDDLPKMKTSVHLVESIQGRLLPSKKVALEFYFPVGFAQEDYKVTIVRYDVGIQPNNPEMSNLTVPIQIMECKLKKLETAQTYSFRQAGAFRIKNAPSNLGRFLSHWGDAEHMETVMSLTFDTLAVMKTAPLKTRRVSAYGIEVNCKDLRFSITYPYPVDYSSITTKLNKKSGTLVLKSPRRGYHFYEERAMFMVNPDNKLVFPPLPVSQTVYSTISGMQFNKTERTIFEASRKDQSPMPANLNVKDWIISFLKQSNKLFTVHSNADRDTGEKSVWLLIAIHSRVFDTVRQTPALDLSYCIMEESIFSKVFQQWRIVCMEPSLSPSAEVVANKEDYLFLSHVLKHFTNRTYRSSKNPSHMLRKYHLDHYFTRAMVYPLYCDPERFLLDIEFMLSSKEGLTPTRNVPFPPWSSLNPANARATATTEDKPAEELVFPNTPSVPTSSSSASSASSKVFTPTDDAKNPIPHSSVAEPTECSYCGSQSDKLKRCTGCGGTCYCGKECQARHWKQHKTVCKPPVIPIAMALPSKCASCGKDTANLKRCACQFVAYCSKECQRNDWTRHRTNCTATRSKK